jgi:chromosome segregation protein
VFLKSLTLRGFKSFAETTTLEFEPGVTVVVGPNGSGKSNIVDAVAWVLGAQGPRTVRSSKMEDVIFAGSGKRPALGRAEVSLTIDNSAGLLPIEFSEVTVTRTLFRDGDSEYAINGVPCRLLDVQELLSDTGVGRQQHVIVSQGQLDAALNARSEDRRLVVEEAAGVLKFRRRKEKAERRLEATEGNLLRLQDLTREVRRQLRPLERQADAARRHDAVAAELSALRKHLAGRELVALKGRLGTAARTRAELEGEEQRTRTALAQLDASVLLAEEQLAARTRDDGEDLAEALRRAESLRERARGLHALLGERQRFIERDRSATIDEDVVANLEADAARTADDLTDVDAASAGLAPQMAEVEGAERALAAELDAYGDTDTADGAGVGADLRALSAAAEARGERAALRAAADRGRAEVSRLEAQLAAVEARAARLAGDAEPLREAVAEAGAAEAPLTESAQRATDRRTGAERASADAQDRCRAAHAALQATEARAEALALALDAVRSRAGAARLADVEGVVGTLLELVEVDPGWEAAFEAAAGEAIAAVVVDGTDSARRALAHLHADAVAGAVVALPDALAARPDRPVPPGTEAVGDHVRARLPGVERLLRQLLAGAVAVCDGGWAAALDAAIAWPELTVVTPAGDRFAPSGWRTGTSGAGVTGAALDDAREQIRVAAGRLGQAKGEADAAEAAARVAGSEAEDAARQLEANAARLGGAIEAVARLEAQRREVAAEAEAIRRHVAEVAGRLDREVERMAELDELLPALEAEEAEGVARSAAARAARGRLEERRRAVAEDRRQLDMRASGLAERRAFLAARLDELSQRLRDQAHRQAGAEARRQYLDGSARATDRLSQTVAHSGAALDELLGRLRVARQAQVQAVRELSARLDQLRRERAAGEKQLADIRDRIQRTELEDAEARVRLESTVESVRRELECEPEAAIETLCPELPPGTTAPHRVRELEREIRLMGPINPLALEEFEALKERALFLEGQLEDVKASRRELTKVIKAIDAEIVEVFRAAFTDVAENFSKLFATLFPGGTGRLRLTDPDNLLETGIEVEARPSGKNVRKLSLLSGGERSLTALAFLFAVFRSRPSPFYLMDEVEAALDDVNLHRFLDLIHEFRDEAQLLIVSHQKRTMEAADCLYGVTMPPGGSSRVVSERVETAAAPETATAHEVVGSARETVLTD